MGRVLDLSGNGLHLTQATGANRPIYTVESGYAGLKFTGASSHFMQSAVQAFGGTNNVFVTAGIKKESDAAQAFVCEYSASLGANNGTFNIQAPASAAGNNVAFASKGTIPITVMSPANVAPIKGVFTGIGCVDPTDVATIRKNQVQDATSAASQGTGPYGNFALYVGARGGVSGFWSGILFSLVICGKAPTAQELDQTEDFVNLKTGAY